MIPEHALNAEDVRAMMLNTMLNPKQSSYRGYEVRLVKLEPHPKKGVRLRRREYVATLVVTRK